MKKFFRLLAVAVIVTSCGVVAKQEKLINTASYSRATASLYVTPVQADLEVSSEKIHHFMEVSDNIRIGGEENVVKTAVMEALDVYGGDVLVGLEKQLKYNDSGQIVSITISGYPAKYVNFRPCENIPATAVTPEADGQSSGGFFGLKK